VDKKILGSKGDIGVFQNAKRSTTVPKEFKLSTGRKGKQAPLSELFNKLTLTTEARRALDHRTADLPNYITTKVLSLFQFSLFLLPCAFKQSN
jgi:hypothetical protein